ncbi:hypothetical protein [cf. Phormidesmis sp. LEGE 11477]|uniref:hypothetical protein n=1 Tax=cf. Phormidesmis sp. LEGE 11477 TaxID=1828680 RepID=UPI0018812547|nr:hypothetical protein [cf. Phormidesmis sp. LEGE 11477]MBE9062346.1 hypothetical protein [cf. Phormidesmis sp. LEGE 11477]
MSDNICLTIDWRTANYGMPDSQQEMLTQQLFRELKHSKVVQSVRRVADSSVPDGAMGAQWLWSILTAEITGNGLRKACHEVYERLAGAPMDLTIEVHGHAQKIDAKNVRPDDFDDVIEKLVAAAQQMKAAE